MAAPSSGAGQSGILSEANAASPAIKLQQANHAQNCTTILNRCQPVQTGIQLNQHQIVQKVPNTILCTQKINSQLNKTSGSNIISYRLTQKNSMSAAHKLNFLQRSGNNIKSINGYGLPQIHETSVNSESEKNSYCSPAQEISFPLQFKISPNVTPGWLRQIAEGDIVYVSPSGVLLKKIEQIKEYLLSPGTCKCGLPCPLYPDKFFEFNPKIPNIILQGSEKSDGANCSNACLHQSSISGRYTLLTKPKTKQSLDQNGDVVIDSLPLKMIVGTSAYKNPKEFGSTHATLTTLSNPVNDVNTSTVVSNVIESVASDITLSRTPPWQKNSILSQHQTIVNQSNELAAPVAQEHLFAQTTQTHLKNVKHQPPWHDETKRRNMVKKRPNFKEDPTGYLEHQTAILHSSILNLHSPELQEEANLEQLMPDIDDDDEKLSATKSIPQTTFHKDIVNHKTPESNEIIQANNTGISIDRMHLASSYIQQYGKPHIAIGPNGQPVRIIQNTQHITHAVNNSSFRPHSSFSQPGNTRNTQKKIIPLSHSQSNINQAPVAGGLSQQMKRSMEVTVPLKISDEKVRDKSKAAGFKTLTETAGLSICVPQSLDNGEKNCDNINQKPNQPQILVKQTATKSPRFIKYTAGSIRKPQESPVSSSTHQEILTIDEILPPQVGAISTSNESFMMPSATISGVHTENSETSVFSTKYHNMYMAAQTSGRNTITSVIAGKTMTSTTSTSQSHMTNEKVKTMRSNLTENTIHVPSNQKYIKANNNQIIQIAKRPCVSSNNGGTSHSNSTSVPSSLNNPSGIQNFQQICNEGSTNQIIMTSTGQILMMPPTVQENKNSNQIIIGSPTNNTLLVGNNSTASNLVINTENPHHLMRNEIIQGINENGTSNMIASGNGMGVVIQSRNVVGGGNANILQSPNHSSNFILGTSNNMQSMILNNSGIISHNGGVLSPTGTTLMPAANNANIIGAANTNKVLSNANNLLASASILNQPHVIGHNNSQIIGGNTGGSLLSPNSGMIGQQTVLLNQLSNGSYVIQPQTITVDGQVMNVISSDGTNQFMQQRLIVSPDSKRRTIKRKSTSLSPSTQLSNESPLPSPTIQQNATSSQQVMQITPHYQSQSFQISPGGAGITLVQNKPSPINTASQQQILLQNGSTILQPINLIGQQLILPTGLMMAPEATTLLQIQNVATNQQFIVNSNGQISPIGQMYTAPMVMVPHSNTGQTQFVQQSATALNPSAIQDAESVQTTQATMTAATVSPPDTTTHSPKSPERSPSQSSGNELINMVQYVSSSEPDSVIASDTDDQSTTVHTEYEEHSNSSHLSNTFKPIETKIRRIQTSPKPQLKQLPAAHRILYKTKSKYRETMNAEKTTSEHNLPSAEFRIGELIWGAARGHPAWPGKIVSAPSGVTTPHDSTWVRWFGSRPNVEMVTILSLKSLSEGLDAHHKAQKDTRK